MAAGVVSAGTTLGGGALIDVAVACGFRRLLRRASANRKMVKALEERGLIFPGKGRDPLTIVWRMKKAKP